MRAWLTLKGLVSRSRYGGAEYSKRVTLYGTVLHDPSAGAGIPAYRMWYRLRIPHMVQARRYLHAKSAYKHRICTIRSRYMCRMGPPDTSPPHRIPELYCPRDDTKPSSFEGAVADRFGRPFVDNDRGDLTCYAESAHPV